MVTTQGATYQGAEQLHTKRVYYTGYDTLVEGYLVCYNRDRGTATSSDARRFWDVEKPTATNLKWFAGVVLVPPETDGAPGLMTIVEPAAHTICNIYTDQTSVTIGSTLLGIQPGSYQAGGPDDGPIIAQAMQTLSAAGLCQAELLGLHAQPISNDHFGAKSRTAVQLPTAAIWSTFPLDALRRNPWLGSLLDTDFTDVRSLVGAVTFKSTGATIALGAGALGIGEMILTEATENEGIGIGWNTPITVSGGNKWGFEIRLHVDGIGNDEGSLAWGLCKYADTLAVASILTADAPPVIVDEAFVGFNIKEADGDKVDVVYSEASQTQNEHSADWSTPIASAYNTYGLYFNGTTIAMYLDGVATGTAISAVDIAATDFPTGEILRPCIAWVADDGGGVVTTVDWIRVAQVAT